ncbi:MAG: hypothetical protein AB7O26_13735 [Planctomycetaceae bacterium]
MAFVRRTASVPLRVAAIGFVVVSSGVCGCTPAMKNFTPSNIWHNLQPHRLQRLNQGPGMSSDAYFSVTDPIPESEGWAKRGNNDQPAAE